MGDDSATDAPRPLVGLSCYEVEASWGAWSATAHLLPARYVRALERAGALCLLLPPQEVTRGDLDHLVERLDALVLAGGNDLDPSHYDEAPHDTTVVAGGRRDELELALSRRASEADLPLLGICRGLQVLNVARGGDLVQHLPDVVGHDGHSPLEGGYGTHFVRLMPGSRVHETFRRHVVEVATHHHQGIGELGAGLRASAVAEDGTIEAVEDETRHFLVGVQWHPEARDEPALFDALVAAARARAGEVPGVCRSKSPAVH